MSTFNPQIAHKAMKNNHENPSFKLRELLRLTLKDFNSLNRIDDKENTPYAILHKKMTQAQSLRANFFYHLYYYLKPYAEKTDLSETFFERQLPFIAEVIITVQYYHNQILDGKGGVTNPQAVNDNLIEGNLLKDQLYRYIQQLRLDKDSTHKVENCVRTIFEWVDVGQYMDKHVNTYQAYRSSNLNHTFENAVKEMVDHDCINEVLQIMQQWADIAQEDLPYLRCYVERIYCTNAMLFIQIVVLMCNLLNVPNGITNQVLYFVKLIGIALQIVNDNCDLVPHYLQSGTAAKICKDAFSDVRNRTVTLPLLLHIKKSPSGEIARFLAVEKHRLNDRVAFDEIVKDLSIYQAMTIGKEIKDAALSYLDVQHEKFLTIEQIAEQADNNRFYRQFYAQTVCYQRYERQKLQRIERMNHVNGNDNRKNRAINDHGS